MITQTTELTKEMVELAILTGTLDKLYGQEVHRLIRLEVSESEENAIFRHKLNGTGDAEFTAHDAFCERCKARASDTIARFEAELGEV